MNKAIELFFAVMVTFLLSCSISTDRFRAAVLEVEKNPQALEELLDILGNPDKPIQYGTFPLHIAIWNESPLAVQMILDRGANPFIKKNGFDAFYFALTSASPEPLKVLLQRFPEVLEDDKFTGSDILIIFDTGREEILNTLLDGGLSVDGTTISSETYLQYICKYANNYPETAILLLKRGANPNLRDPEGWPPIMRASNNDIVKALIDHGAEINATGPKGHTAMFYNAASKRLLNVKTLIECGAILQPDLVVMETHNITTSNTDWGWVENVGNPNSVLRGDFSYEKTTTTTSFSHDNVVPLLDYAENHDKELAEMLIARGYK